MYTERQTFHRISYLIFLIGVLSVGLTGQRAWSSWLHNLSQSATMMTSASPSQVVAAGPPALLLLNADALVAPINNGVATLTARVRDAEGKPVAGVAVSFASDLGTLSPATASTDANGVASATFTAGGTPGQAIVTATAGDFTQTAAIQVVKPNANAPQALALEVGNGRIPNGQQTGLTVRLRDAAGQPLAGELVTFFGALGTVTPASAVTDAEGRATARFQAGTISGQALITALAGSASQSVSIQVGDQVTPPPPPGSGDEHSIYLPVVTR
jgi:adhesin/invasin